MKVVFVDNFDSFTFNLVDEFARRGCDVEVWRNSARAEHVLDRATTCAGPSMLVLSPGPGRPEEAGCCLELIRLAAGRVPVFGVCLALVFLASLWPAWKTSREDPVAALRSV